MNSIIEAQQTLMDEQLKEITRNAERVSNTIKRYIQSNKERLEEEDRKAMLQFKTQGVYLTNKWYNRFIIT